MNAGDPSATPGFVDVMAEVISPVSVVTTTVGGVPHGTTVSAFCSLSLRPSMVAVALDRGSDLLAKVRTTHRFGVNVLAHSQDDLALRFACKGADKFEDVPWTEVDGLPRLDDAIGWLSCRVEAFVEAGDHIVLTGLVDTAVATPAPPLAYHRRTFGTHCELARSAG